MNQSEQKPWSSTAGGSAGSPEVLIVGAGPIGMVLACELLQQGVRVRLIDQLELLQQDDPHSRAILVVPRALELLRRIGVSERMVEVGRQVPGIGYYSEGRLLGTARFNRMSDTPYPFILALPQRATENVLRQRLHELGGSVERGVSLEDLTSPEGPRVLLRHPDGSAEEVNPQWMVGADGAASVTRRYLGTELGGDPTDVTYVIADAPVSGPITSDARYYYSRNGLVAIIPMRDGLYRVAGNVPHRVDGQEPRWQELLQDIVNHRTRAQLTVGEPTYARLVRPRCGAAGVFRSGRCFLVGDAAHVITPAGGQGMNLGIQDAVNLGWKLGGVLRGRLAEQVLDSYHTERSAAVARMSATTARIVSLSLLRGRLKVGLRDATFKATDRAGLVQRVLAPLLSQLDVDYGLTAGGPLRIRRQAAHPGQRVPAFAPLPTDGAGSAWLALDRDRYTVLAWPGRLVAEDWGVTLARLRGRVLDRAAVLDGGIASGGAAAALRQIFGDSPLVAVVRPDGHLAHVTEVGRTDETLRFLRAAAPMAGTAAAALGVPA